jgi:membrane protein DedA with SNARE-associated domain
LELIKHFIHQIFIWLADLGYWGIMLGLMIEVIPSEIVLSYGGFLVSRGDITFWGAVLFGTIGGTIAQIFVYWIGRYGGRPFLEKYGKFLLIHKKHIDISEQWFNKYGTGVIFTARFIPVVRHAISIPAGIAKMPLSKFTLYTTLAVIPWSVFFIYLGMTLGENWEQIDEKAAPYVMPFVIASLVLTAGYLAYKIMKGRSAASTDYGRVGEKKTAHQLKFLGREYRVLHRRRLRAGDNTQEIDHLIVGPNGVFHIETKHWSGDIAFTADGVKRSNGAASEDPTAQMYRHEYVVKELLRQHHIRADAVGILCFTHPQGAIMGKSPAFVTLKVDRLLHFIKTYKTKTKLAPKEVAAIARLFQENSTK